MTSLGVRPKQCCRILQQATITLVCLASVAAAAPPSLRDIESMRSLAEQQGLAAFVAATTANSWQAPVIPSAWYVRHLAPPTDRPYFEAGRQLGLTLLDAIDVWAPLMRSEASGDIMTKSTVLIDVAYWLGGSEGYANLILARRARDVAVTGLGRLVADMAVPLGATQVQLQRCRAPFDAPSVRARVLNFEAGTALFLTDPATTDQDLADVWTRAEMQTALAKLNALPTPAADDERAGRSALNELLAALGLNSVSMTPADAFFTDDEQGDVPTTRRLWDRKRHEELVATTVPQNVESIETLAQFRTTIGAFPLEPSQRMEHFSTPGEEAFAEAWEPHIGTATFNLGRGAWAVYDRIRMGHLMDYDSAASMAAAARGVRSQ